MNPSLLLRSTTLHLLLVGLGAIGSACAAPQYTIQLLPDLGTASSNPRSIDSAGNIAGTAYLSSANSFRATLYTGGSTLQDLGTLGGAQSQAYGLSDSGVVVGYSTTATGTTHAFYHTADDQMLDIGTLGGASSLANAVNNAGTAVGRANTATALHAFSYTPLGGIVDLGSLAGSSGGSEAFAINSQGIIVGSSATTGGPTHAFVFANGAMGDLGTLGGTSSTAHGINASGAIVGTSATTGNAAQVAFLYQNFIMTNLGALSGGDSNAYAINSAGQVVGSAIITGGQSHATLFQDGTVYDLNDLIPSDSGYILTVANSINDSGQIAVTGRPDGTFQELSFILTPVPAAAPTPAAPALKISGSKKLTTTKSRLTIKGSATGSVTSVTYTIGKKKRTAKGTSAWSFTVPLTSSKTNITVLATGPGGNSAPVRITITRS